MCPDDPTRPVARFATQAVVAMAAAGVRFCDWRKIIPTGDPVKIGQVDDPFDEIDAIMVDVFKAVAIGVVILSIARPLLKLAGIVVICVLVLLFV